jgi:hypothetical protein
VKLKYKFGVISPTDLLITDNKFVSEIKQKKDSVVLKNVMNTPDTYIIKKIYKCTSSWSLAVLGFWVATPCGLVGGYQRFGGTHCPNLKIAYKDGGRLEPPYKFAQCQNLEDTHPYLHRRENLTSFHSCLICWH